MPPAVRTRSMPTLAGVDRKWHVHRVTGAISNLITTTHVLTDMQRTYSAGTGFPSWQNRMKAGKARKGVPDFTSPFWTVRSHHSTGGQSVYLRRQVSGTYDQVWSAPLLPVSVLPITEVTGSSDGQMDTYGTILIARALPTNPLASMGQFLGELLKDGIPKPPILDAWKNKARFFKGLNTRQKGAKLAGDSYLNVVFGWQPFIKDILDFVEVTGKWDVKAKQFAKDSGKLIRRKRSFGTVESVTSTTATGRYPVGLPSAGWATAGTLHTTTKTVIERKLSAGFMYYLSEGYSDRTVRQSSFTSSYANRMLGLRLTPDLLWKLAPWSWAADWVFNTGSIIRNFSAFSNDGLVMRYGCVTEVTTTTRTDALVGCKAFDGTSLDCTLTTTSRRIQRRRATPYGFGLNPQTFTGKQWAILGALGLAKRPKSF